MYCTIDDLMSCLVEIVVVMVEIVVVMVVNVTVSKTVSLHSYLYFRSSVPSSTGRKKKHRLSLWTRFMSQKQTQLSSCFLRYLTLLNILQKCLIRLWWVVDVRLECGGWLWYKWSGRMKMREKSLSLGMLE